ncbi:MAG: hypothetical protein Q7S01_03725 [bacterium]|nr:hypothetical protein [bacterium]
MTSYVVECTCGHDLKVNASGRDDAVEKAKRMMDKDGIMQHYKKHHPGETVPSVAEIHAHIEQDIRETVAAR